MTPKTPFAVVERAIGVLLRRLEALPPSLRKAHLRAQIDDCMMQTARWGASSPATHERDGVMKRVLSLHVEVTELEHRAWTASRGEEPLAAS